MPLDGGIPLTAFSLKETIQLMSFLAKLEIEGESYNV